MRAPLAAALALAVAGASIGGCARGADVLHVSATTSMDNSGLLAAIIPAFEAESGIDVSIVVGGSGRALAVLERGDADLSWTHDPAAEQTIVDSGVAARYRKVMYNDFVIAGPAADPAGVRAAADAIDAMRRIAASGSSFASRADSSGTHTRELSLWRDAGMRPAGAALIETGSGQAATLRVATERQAYVLTDRATYAQVQATLRLAILHEGDPTLLNLYAVMTRAGLDDARHARADRLFDWLTDGDGRRHIAGFQIGGQPAFLVWPAGAPRDHPGDLPHAR
jgi:tungstate transport system substrate-binding protein